MRASLTVFPQRGLAPHQFTPMSGAHETGPNDEEHNQPHVSERTVPARSSSSVSSPFGIMKRLASISVFSLLLVGCASHRTAQSDFYFLPCAAKASVSFEGETQSGPSVHRFEVRRLAYVVSVPKKERPTMSSCVIYYAGDEYGPLILCQLEDCIDPLVRKVSTDEVEVYFLAGTHTHIRQRWRLLGYAAKLEKEEEISWRDDPRMKVHAAHTQRWVP